MIKSNLLKRIEKKIKTKKKLSAMFFAVAIFLFVAHLTFSASDLIKQDIPDYQNLIKDNGGEYRNYINSANRDTKKLLESSQLNQIKQYENLIEEKDYEKRDNPFSKPFK
jgi:hypothetical protein